MSSSFAENYWSQTAERDRLMPGSRAERLEYEGKTFEAIELVDDLIWNEDPGIVALLVDLAEAAPNDDALGGLTGPMSNLIHSSADRFLDELEEAARKNPRFRLAIASAIRFGWSDLSRPVRERLEKFV